MITEFLQGILNPIQFIGYLGTACAITSYQCKSNKNYFIFQTGCSIFFGLQFALLGAWAGMLLNIFSILRGIIFALGDKFKKSVYLISLEICFAISCTMASVFFGEKWWMAIILFAAQGGGTLAMWTRNGKKIRIAQLCLISPIWLINDIYYASIGGVLCEIFNITSVIVSFIRFRKIGYDEK